MCLCADGIERLFMKTFILKRNFKSSLKSLDSIFWRRKTAGLRRQERKRTRDCKDGKKRTCLLEGPSRYIYQLRLENIIKRDFLPSTAESCFLSTCL